MRPLIAVLLIASALVSCAPRETLTEPRTAVASWYGEEFEGRPTASGVPFSMHAHTAAHRDFPFGTTLRVTNLSNSQSVVVVVNDRGPFVTGRDLDLSYGAAKSIGLIRTGTGTVLIEPLGRDASYVRQARYVAGSGPYTVQVGSFADPENARHLKAALEWNHRDAYLAEVRIGDAIYHRVRVGKFDHRSEAMKKAGALAAEGYEAVVMEHRGDGPTSGGE